MEGRKGWLTYSVSFSTPDEATLTSLTKSLRELEETVITPDGRKAIKSFKGGRQTSVEGHEKGMKVVFLLEFEVHQLNYSCRNAGFLRA